MSEIDRDELMDAVVRELRRPVPVSALLDERVMSEIRAGEAGGWRAFWTWLRAPRTFAITPLGGLAGAGVVAAMLVLAVTAPRDRVQQPASLAVSERTSAPTPSDSAVVQFVLVAPGASSVVLVGDFNDWSIGATPLELSPGGGGGSLWEVRVALTPGRHRYAFVVDGEEWRPDPAAPLAPGDNFGEPSSVVTVNGSSI